MAIFFLSGDYSHVCFCEHKNGKSPQNGIICGYNSEDFVLSGHCPSNYACIGPTKDDPVYKRIPSFRKKELCGTDLLHPFNY